MGKKSSRSPRVRVEVTPERWATAKRSDSGACVIADSIRDAYPNLSHITVTMRSISATDRAKGERYTWLTPDQAASLLLHFDQGWSQPSQHRVTLNGASHVTSVRGANRQQTPDRRARLAELEAKEAGGELTGRERGTLTRMRAVPERPTSTGPVAEVVSDGADHGQPTVIGGDRMEVGAAKNPNLLGSRRRVFGAKLATPDEAFRDAVEAEVARRLAEHAGPTGDATG